MSFPSNSSNSPGFTAGQNPHTSGPPTAASTPTPAHTSPISSRRAFLRTGALVTAGFAAGLRAAETAGKRRPLKKALMLGTFRTQPRREVTVLDQFKMLKEAGFHGVEPNSHMDTKEVLAARDTTGLEIPSVCCGTHWAKPLSDPNPSVRNDGLEGLKAALRDAKAYGATSVLLVPAVVNKQVSYADAYARSQAEIRKAIPLAEELGVKIAIENVWNMFLLSPLEAARYVDEFNSPAVGWHFDIGNIIRDAYPEQWIRALGRRIQMLHVKEYSRKKRDKEGPGAGFQVEYLEGDNDWPAVMKALDEISYRGWGIAEPTYRGPDFDDAGWLRNISERMDRIYAS